MKEHTWDQLCVSTCMYSHTYMQLHVYHMHKYDYSMHIQTHIPHKKRNNQSHPSSTENYFQMIGSTGTLTSNPSKRLRQENFTIETLLEWILCKKYIVSIEHDTRQWWWITMLRFSFLFFTLCAHVLKHLLYFHSSLRQFMFILSLDFINDMSSSSDRA